MMNDFIAEPIAVSRSRYTQEVHQVISLSILTLACLLFYFPMPVTGMVVFALVMITNIQYAMEDYGMSENSLHAEMIAQTSNSGGGSSGWVCCARNYWIICTDKEGNPAHNYKRIDNATTCTGHESD